MRKIFSEVLIPVFIGFSFILFGCEVDHYRGSEDSEGSGSSMFGDGVNVPSGFDWSTIKSEKLTVKVDDRYKGQYYYQVEIFDENPIFSKEAKLFLKGVAKQGQDWIAALDLPSYLEVIWVRQINPVGQGVVKAVNVSGGELFVDFTPKAPLQTRASYVATGNIITTRSGDEEPSTIYTTPTINGTDVLELSGEENKTFAWNAPTHVIPAGKTFKGNLTFSWANPILYVEGTWENTSADIQLNGWTVIVQNGGKFVNNAENKTFKVNGTSQLIVAAGGEFGTTGAPMKLSEDGDGKIINSGTIVTAGLFDIRYLYNYGNFNLNGKTEQIGSNCNIVNKGNFIINNGIGNANAVKFQGNFRNDGTVTVSGILHSDSDNFVLTNTGFFEVHTLGLDATSHNAAKGTIDNNGQFVVTDDAFIALTFNVGTGALLEVKNLTMFDSAINLADNVMLVVTEKLTVSIHGAAKIIGGPDSGTALARINEVAVPNNTNFALQGELEVECSNYQELPESGTSSQGKTTGEDVRFVEVGESTVIIPPSEYNKGGNNNDIPGTPVNPVFPIIYDGTSLTYLFEDSWPYLGDYDMNDLVLDVVPTYSLNPDNKVTQLQLEVTLRAAGASKRLAVGLQLDGIAPGMISNISRSNNVGVNGNVFTQSSGLETGQTYAVIPIFDDVHEAFGNLSAVVTNTVKGSENNKTPREVTFTINFANPVDQSSISVYKFNVFIINAGYKNKRQEIHLAEFLPTDRADRSKFGLGDDNSNIRPYTSKNNMIWGLAVPAPTNYPLEWKSIRLAYPDLESWATSGGANSKDWYKNFVESSVYR